MNKGSKLVALAGLGLASTLGGCGPMIQYAASQNPDPRKALIGGIIGGALHDYEVADYNAQRAAELSRKPDVNSRESGAVITEDMFFKDESIISRSAILWPDDSRMGDQGVIEVHPNGVQFKSNSKNGYALIAQYKDIVNVDGSSRLMFDDALRVEVDFGRVRRAFDFTVKGSVGDLTYRINQQREKLRN